MISLHKNLIKYKRFQNLNLNQLKIISDRSFYDENRNEEETDVNLFILRNYFKFNFVMKWGQQLILNT